MKLITIDMDALAKAIDCNTDANEQDARAIINTVLYRQPVALSTLTDEQIDEAAHELQRVIAFCGGEPSEFPYDYLRGILEKLPAAAAPAQQAGQSWKLVPVEPTQEMLDAAHESDREYTLRNFGDVMTVQQGPWDHWTSMIAASPTHERAASAPEPIAEVFTEDNRTHLVQWLDGVRDLPDGTHKLYVAAPSQPVAAEGVTSNDLRKALHEAATSLETIGRQAGRGEHMEDALQVRGYADSRAQVARAALSGTSSERSKPLPPAALAAARKFGAGLDGDSLEQPSEVV